ncbi:radical SAM family heme chaperone HemW [Pontimicrobium sp. IMCC45349]|uniref:radical SAM family heme chaperone HemW n=1 Tax=Pontimicrobium sp. IMCC45349 TaxID=3391574 RepID=UPI0039A35C00
MSGIYIHIPFCKQACYYCDFHFSTSLKKKDELINALIKEIQLRKDELLNQTVETIYFGGGTPSILSNAELQLIIDEVYKNYKIIDAPEITLEANPDDLSNKRINELANTPINRLSIGIQSFFEDDLKSMNRAHNAIEAKQCLNEATKHFDNITIDLIYGIPNMSLKKWNENLQMAFDLGINHISSYALTVEEKTALDNFIKKGTYPPVDEVLASQHFDHLVKRTQEEGFIHYEISNFGKPNYFSKHNTSYWQGKTYLGIGPSAHSFNGKQRSWNIANNTKYIKSLEQNKLPSEIEILTKNDRYNEYIMTGLRTIWGISLNKIDTEFGEAYKEKLLLSVQKFIDKELVVISNKSDKSHKYANSNSFIKTTQKGKFLADGIASDLFILN